MKRKFLICVLVLALFLPVCLGLVPQHGMADEAYHTVRVKLSMASSSSCKFKIAGNYFVSESPSFLLTNGDCTISIVNDNLKISNGSASMVVGPKITLRRYQGATNSSTYLTVNNQKYGNTKYLGDMEFSIVNGSVRLINYVPVETYLYGVVAYEMSNSFPLEALKAQAVCARGYVIDCMQSASSSSTYDIGDTSSDQVYRGYVSSYERVIQAVNETAGKVLTYDGDIIRAYFSASNGGQTERYDNWAQSNGNSSKNLAYYQNADDPYDVANPSSLEELSYIPQTFTEEAIEEMDDIIYDLLLDGAKAQLPDAESVTLKETLSVTPDTRKWSYGESNCYRYALVEMTVVADEEESEVTVKIDLDSLVYSSSNKDGIFSRNYNLRMRGAEVSSDASFPGWYLTSRRWGHGVGMSQRGAQQRAKEGQKYDEILAFYYVNTTMTDYDTKAEDLPALPAVSGVPGRVTSSTLNVRQGPSTSFSVIGTVERGRILTIVRKNAASGWHQVYYEGQLGYVSSGHITILSDATYSIPGWLTTLGEKYYLDENGMILTGLQKIGDKAYYFNADGLLQTGLIVDGEKMYYANESGELQTGSVSIGGKKFTFDEETYAADADDVVLDTSSYEIDRAKNTISGVPREVAIADFKKAFSSSDTTIRIVNAAGQEVTSGVVGTGMRIQTVVGDSAIEDLTILVRADVNGDGYIDVNDILEIQSYILGKKEFGYAQFAVADINEDTYADVNDILCIVEDIIGKKMINP